jgi:hypothetical protein
MRPFNLVRRVFHCVQNEYRTDNESLKNTTQHFIYFRDKKKVHHFMETVR